MAFGLLILRARYRRICLITGSVTNRGFGRVERLRINTDLGGTSNKLNQIPDSWRPAKGALAWSWETFGSRISWLTADCHTPTFLHFAMSWLWYYYSSPGILAQYDAHCFCFNSIVLYTNGDFWEWAIMIPGVLVMKARWWCSHSDS